MGYRSEVTLTMYEKDFQEMIQKAKSESPDVALPFITKWARLYKNDNIITLFWDWVKWYEGFEDVGFVEDFMHSGVEYSFRRVGEETGDIDEEYNDDTWLLCEATCVSCSIDLGEAGDEQNMDEYIGSISNTELQADNDDDESIEPVSEEALLELITA